MPTYLVPASIDATGATDVTADLAAWLSTVPDGTALERSLIEFPAGSVYRTEGSVVLTERHHFTVVGNDAQFVMDELAGYDRPSWAFYSCTNFDVTSVRVRGANPYAGLEDLGYSAAQAAQHGFAFWSCTTARLTDCQVANVWGDWVYLGMSGGDWCDDVVIENNDFVSNGRQGFGFVACRNVVVRFNTTGECRRSLLDFEPNGAAWGCDNVHIHDNTFGPHRLSFIASKGLAGPVDNILIEDNAIARTMSSEINPQAFNTRNNWTIRRNTAALHYGAPNQAALRFWRTDGLTVIDNVQPLQSGRNMHMVRVSDCTEYTVTGNTITPGGVGQVLVVDSPDVGEDPQSDAVFTEPEVVGSSTVSSTGPEPILTVPVDAQPGDSVFVQLGHMGSDFFDLVPPGWDHIGSVATLPDHEFPAHFHMLRRTLSGEASFTFPQVEWGTSNRTTGILFVVRGLGSLTPEDARTNVDQSFESALISVPAVTTRTPGCIVLYFACQRGGAGTISDPDAEVAPIATANNASTPGAALFAGYRIWSGAGTGKERTFSSTSADADGAVVVAYPTRTYRRRAASVVGLV